MRKFIILLIYFLTLPILIILFLAFFYVKRDVYLDFNISKDYSWRYYFQSSGDISTKKLLNSHLSYNSFVFGSSRSTSLYGCYLQKQIKNSIFFHYANWGESIGGIYSKIKLLDSLGYNLNNIIFYFDTDYTFEGEGICKNDHYLLTKENKYDYYINHFLDFLPPRLNLEKFKVLLNYEIDKKVNPNIPTDFITNDYGHVCSDSIIDGYGRIIKNEIHLNKIDSLKKNGLLYKRPNVQLYHPKQISFYEQCLMLEIKKLLLKHKTKFAVIITPLYDQKKFDKSDFLLIKKIFDNKVYDFSGINKFTNNEFNYTDVMHFQPYISKIIADSIVGSYL